MFGITSALSVEGPTEKDKVMTEDLQSKLACQIRSTNYSRNNRALRCFRHARRSLTPYPSADEAERARQRLRPQGRQRMPSPRTFARRAGRKDLHFRIVQTRRAHQ